METRIVKGNINLEDVELAYYNVDMNEGFVNFGAMANPAYNALVPEQLKTLEDVRKRNGLVNFVLEGHEENSLEFETYPKHCVLGTREADLIPELIGEQDKDMTIRYYKNCINGMLTGDVPSDINKLKQLKEVIIQGVCSDLCVMDFARTYARYLDQLNRKAHMFVLKNTIDTFDAPGHDRNEWNEIACKVMAQAGIHVVEDFNELVETEKKLGLRK